MRLRLAFKLHGDEADLARQIADAAEVDIDKLAKLAMQRYIREVLERAEQAAKEKQDARLQPSSSDSEHVDGTLPPPSGSVPSPTSGQS